MNTECISYPEDDVFAISIPTSKETPYHTPEYNTYNRKFSGYCEGILYESLREQQNEVRKIAPNQGYLFAGAYGTMVTAESFNRYLQTVIDNHNIVDSSGQPAHITSHNFRHIDISERLRSGVISDAQTMKESNHSSLRQTYEYGYQSLHDESKRLGEITEKVFRDKYGFENDTSQNTQPKEVVKRKYNRMLEMPQTRIIPAYGICCNPACTPRFERCIQCGNFDPDPVFYDYFEAAIKRLEDRIAMLEQKRGDPKVIASCRSQLGIYQMFIEKIKTERRAFV